MIRTKIQNVFSHHLQNCTTTTANLYVADYTEQTRLQAIKRATELFDGSPPNDIDYFTVENPLSVEIDGIPFDNRSFTRRNGSPLSQCECAIYPHNNIGGSWILFLELKYSNNEKNNKRNLNKARKQLFKTRYYYKSMGIINKNNTCYLLASMPMQSSPFANISLSQPYLLAMKKKHNIVIRFQNSAKIKDYKIIEL
ncbi:hypothetical protein [Alloprevotella sp. oral taxon 473]|uniref:hypothetical protein n=1 Tax=Alloprevotella sp. oral taxon 473 TaxID=712469 RepID=UPI0002A38E99|nr:hypothetical protein [Alloprevotella sp. oral taxon 473]EKX89938.1 hypothetical protein HMPREF9999_01394 [Alloprevotella sp. oral taxon 473 str. F0040]